MNELDITDLIGDQSPTGTQDANNHQVYFRIPVVNAAGQTTSFAMHRVVCNAAQAYYSIDELLGDTRLLPPNRKVHSVNMLMRFIAEDSRQGLGVKVRDYPLVAYAGRSVFDKPIAAVRTVSGDVRYYASPVFQNAVKRI